MEMLERLVAVVDRTRDTLTALAAVAVVSLAATVATAQTVQDVLELTRQKVETQRRVLVAGALPLTDAEAKAFWPLYDDYERERRALDERSNRLVADFVAGAASLSDAQAKAMLEEALKVDEGRLRLRRTFMDRMAKAIPPRKLVRFFQIENKLDSIVRADLSRQIPLAP
jgi:Spy/CpxP family protein refolding chaperone